MTHEPMSPTRSQVLVGQRYLEQGFLDTALRLFVRNAALVPAQQWTALAERLMERNRITDVVQVCTLGGIPLPRERFLALGDDYARRKNFEEAIRFYELAEADRERWAHMVDLLTTRPDQQRRAIELTDRYLVGAGSMAEGACAAS